MIHRLPFTGAVALMSTLLLAHCDGDGNSTQRVYFSMTSNYDGCAGEEVRLYLDSSDAVLGRNEDGSVSCQLEPALADDSCDLVVREDENGAWFDFWMDDCRISNVANLFYCDFVQVTGTGPNLGLVTSCGCGPTSCHLLGRCSLCASLDPDRSNCENCDNNVDDDGDGRADCEDFDCDFSEECGYGATTLLCDSTTTTTTTSSTTSTVTILALGAEVEEICSE
jgi:hypothetical protein